MFHEMFDLKGLENEIRNYREKVSDEELFIPDNWLPENFTTEDLRKILIKSIDSGKNFEEFMPDEYRKNLKDYLKGIGKGFIY
nr:MAG TPA: hypothetical protein [Caudoviricetes sp.]